MGSERGARVVESYATLAREVLRRPATLGSVRLVVVDGPSGGGKTHFAGRLAAALREAGAQVTLVQTDDLLDGWDDQFTFWPRLEVSVLGPLRAGRAGTYQRYDWHRARFGEETVSVPPHGVVILEGVSAARAEIRREATLSVFVTVPYDVGLARAVQRDGEALRPYLLRWQSRERPHFAADRTAAHVDVVVAGAADISYDRQTHFVRVDAPADSEGGSVTSRRRDGKP